MLAHLKTLWNIDIVKDILKNIDNNKDILKNVNIKKEILKISISKKTFWYRFHFQPQPECPLLPPTPGHLCVTPAGAQDCHYDICCCGRCGDPITCAHDSTTGFGRWQSMQCPAEGCGSEGEWWKIILSLSWKQQVSSPHQTTLRTILTT